MWRIRDTLEPKVGGWVDRTGWGLVLPRGSVYRHVEPIDPIKLKSYLQELSRVIWQNTAIAATESRAPGDENDDFFTKNTVTNMIS